MIDLGMDVVIIG